jgi:GH24 family phage-related lysozyme (muramidase)
MRISQAAFDLIVAEEVSSEATYTRKYQRPVWPGAQSGPTVGIGYDLGQTYKSGIKSDWQGRVSDEMLEWMVWCSGKTGAAGKAATARVKDKILVPWNIALAVHKECAIPSWEDAVSKALPNTDKLSPDCFGALVSLAYNRGPSFNKKGDRYKEMRAIKAHIEAGSLHLIPHEIRAMKRLWDRAKLPGLHKRRDREAELFERGLSQAPAQEAPHGKENDEIKQVQKLLDLLGYHEVGDIDGKWGGKTAGAIAAFRNDRHLSGGPGIDEELKAELQRAMDEDWDRPIAEKRAEATAEELAPKVPEVKKAAKAEKVGWWGTIGVGITTGLTIVMNFFGQAMAWLSPIQSIAEGVPWWWWIPVALVVCGLLAYVANKAGDAKLAAVKAYQTGERN